MGTDQRKLLRLSVLFLVPVLVGLVALGTWFAWKDSVPPITNSFSFDAKLEELRNKRPGRLDVVLLGSSLTLNNVSSQAIDEVLGPQRRTFHNMSAWGLTPTDMEALGYMYVERHQPQTVVICTSTEDFDGRSGLDMQARPILEAYMDGTWKGWYFMRFPLVARIKEWKENINVNSVQDSLYTSLMYDAHGGVALRMTPTSISKKRLDQPFHYSAKHEEEQYDALDRFSHWLKERGVRLVLVRTPVRRMYSSGPVAQAVFAEHARRCAELMRRDGHTFIDRMDLPMEDAWFVDVNHLGAEGAYVFTRSWAAEALQ
jgi:hypothetical protein